MAGLMRDRAVVMVVPELVEGRCAVASGILCSTLEAEAMATAALHLVASALILLNPGVALRALPHIIACQSVGVERGVMCAAGACFRRMYRAKALDAVLMRTARTSEGADGCLLPFEGEFTTHCGALDDGISMAFDEAVEQESMEPLNALRRFGGISTPGAQQLLDNFRPERLQAVWASQIPFAHGSFIDMDPHHLLRAPLANSTSARNL